MHLNRTCWWTALAKLDISSNDSIDLHLYRPLNELVEFRSDEGNAAYRPVLPLTVRKMIAREVELEQMRRNEATASLRRNGSSKVMGKVARESSDVTIEEKAAKVTYALPELSGTCCPLLDPCVGIVLLIPTSILMGAEQQR